MGGWELWAADLRHVLRETMTVEGNAMQEFEGKTVIVTGAANGIGRAAAKELGRRGARVSVADLAGPDGEQVAAEIRDAGGDARFIATDVSRAADCEAMVRDTMTRYGKLDMAFNN